MTETQSLGDDDEREVDWRFEATKWMKVASRLQGKLLGLGHIVSLSDVWGPDGEGLLSSAELLSTTDAAVWAREFCRRFAFDEGTMLGWFAGAIETGADRYASKIHEADLAATLDFTIGELIRLRESVRALRGVFEPQEAGQ